MIVRVAVSSSGAGAIARTWLVSPAFTSNASAWRHCNCIRRLRRLVGTRGMEWFQSCYIDVTERNGSPSLEPTIF